jgi:AcrR family transcriptional regulator
MSQLHPVSSRLYHLHGDDHRRTVTTTGTPAGRSRRGRRPDLAPDVERTALLDAGLAVLRRNGYERATLDDVLTESGLSTRAVYRHFRTIDELLCAVFRRDADQAVNKLVARLAQAPTALQGLQAWVDEVLSLAYNPRRNQRLHLVGFRGFHSPAGGLRAESERGREMSIAPLVEVLQAGRADGVFPDAEPELDAQAIQAIITSALNGSGAFCRLLPNRHDASAYVMRLILPKLGHPS